MSLLSPACRPEAYQPSHLRLWTFPLVLPHSNSVPETSPTSLAAPTFPSFWNPWGSPMLSPHPEASNKCLITSLSPQMPRIAKHTLGYDFHPVPIFCTWEP